MATQSDYDFNNPFAAARELRDATLDALAKTMVGAVNTDTFARALGAYLDTYLALTTPFTRMIDETSRLMLARFNMPSRAELTTLAERLTAIEMRLDDMDFKLDTSLAERAAPPAADAALAERIARLDARVGELLAVMQREAPAPLKPPRSRKPRTPRAKPEGGDR
jgi:hypothetical protein